MKLGEEDLVNLKDDEILVTGKISRNKDSKTSWTLYGVKKFEDWEKGQGFKCINEWTNRCDLSDISPGDILRPIFGRGFQGKAILVDVQLVKSVYVG